jgi:hypothetical protein
MSQVIGPWCGSGVVKGRIFMNYTVAWNAGHTAAQVDGTFYIQTDNSISDVVNSWAVSGDAGSHSGSNIDVTFGSGGGYLAFYSFTLYSQTSTVSVAASVSSLQAVGVTVSSGTFDISVQPLAPYLTANGSATSVTSSSFATTGLAAYGNGSALNNAQFQWNTSPTDVGCGQVTLGMWANTTIGGLYRNTTYYWRVRPCNAGYGWGAWGPWQAVTTLPTVPSGPSEAWYFSGITSVGANVVQAGVADDGGSGLTNWQTHWNQTTGGDGYYPESGSGSWAPGLSGLYRASVYYAQIRAGNAYGWGPWSGWKGFWTLSTLPSPPAESWSVGAITQTSADATGLANTNDGGSAIDSLLVRVSLTPDLSGWYTDFTGGWGTITMSGLNPGTTYYACVYTHNANGWSAATAWKGFTTLPGVFVKVGGVWKNAIPYVKVGGVWKQAVRYVKVGGAWKQ